MNKTYNPIALVAIVAVAMGFAGVSALADSPQPELTGMEQLAIESGIYGHLEVVQTNADGEVIAYRQTDNVVTTQGLECAAEILFAGAAIGSNNCTIVSFPEAFDTVELISSGTPVAGDTEISSAGAEITGVLGLAIAQGGCAIADGAGNGSAVCTVTFTAGSGVSAQTVSGAYLKDNTTATAIFAGNTFTSVSMNDSDTLLVTWTITLS